MKKENIDFLQGIETILSARPSKLLWLVPTLIGIFILIVILWLTFSQIDVIAPSQGKTIPSSRMILIQPKEISIIDKIYVKNGEVVKQGDLLVEFKNSVELFENDSMKSRYNTLILKKIYHEAFIQYIDGKKYELKFENTISEDLRELIKNRLSTAITSYDTEIVSLKNKISKVHFEHKMIQTEIKKQEELLPYTKYKLDQITKLVQKGLEAEMTMKDLEKEYLEQKSNLLIKKDELEKFNSRS